MVSRKGWVQRFSQTPLDERLGPNNFTVTYDKLNVEKERNNLSGTSVERMNNDQERTNNILFPEQGGLFVVGVHFYCQSPSAEINQFMEEHLFKPYSELTNSITFNKRSPVKI